MSTSTPVRSQIHAAFPQEDHATEMKPPQVRVTTTRVRQPSIRDYPEFLAAIGFILLIFFTSTGLQLYQMMRDKQSAESAPPPIYVKP